MKHKIYKSSLMLTVVLVLMLSLVGTVGAEDGRVGQTKGDSLNAMTFATMSSLSVDDTLTPGQLAGLLVGAGVNAPTISNVFFTGNPSGSGAFNGATEPVGLESGVVLGSGRVVDVIGPNTADAITTNFGLPGDSDLNTLIPGYFTYDATVLEFDFVCPTGTSGGDVISFRYVFTSEEYNEYVNSSYNDVFGFFLNGANIALLPDGITPVSINNVNNGYSFGGGLPGTNPSNPSYYINNDLNDGGPFIDIEADGLTVVLGAQANINPGATNHMRLAIADAGDSILDSWVFIEAGSFVCAPLNQPPVADANGPYYGNEGSPITFDGTGSNDPDGDSLTYDWDFGDGSPIAENVGPTPSHTYEDNHNFIVTLTVKDGQATNSDTVAVTVNNVAPTLTIVAPTDGALYTVNTVVNLSASFTDPGTADTHLCSVNWDDGAGAQTGTVSEAAGSGTCTGNKSLALASIYNIAVTVTDDDGGSDTKSVMIVVYDPNGGFATGGGWINSPAGAYKPDETLSGKANFGFVSKYQKGATVPTGNTEFQFHAAGLNFHSSNYEWLVVTGGNYARFKGTGTINGMGAYKFMLWAGDGSPDTFRIKIWEEDAYGVETVIYDNGFDQAIGGGSIVIHKGK